VSVPPPPRLVVFDLGGVLVRICRSWDEACAAAGLPCREGAEAPEVVEERRRHVFEHEAGRLSADVYFERLSRGMDGLYSPDEVRRVHDAWTLREFEGVPALLDALDAARVETAVLSNTNERHWRRLSPPAGEPVEYPSLLRIPHRFASHLLGARKPDPEVFAHVEAATGRAGRDVLFFDDLLDNVAAARAAGWRAEVVDPLADPPARMLEVLAREGVPVRARGLPSPRPRG
jgi:putative hydrolase of the HAD superfamily